MVVEPGAVMMFKAVESTPWAIMCETMCFQILQGDTHTPARWQCIMWFGWPSGVMLMGIVLSLEVIKERSGFSEWGICDTQQAVSVPSGFFNNPNDSTSSNNPAP